MTSSKEFHQPAVNSFFIMLTELQTKTLRALVDCIVPADDYPSGWEAGVGHYLARLLTLEPQFLFLYQSGLDMMEADTNGFHLQESAAQNALLTELEQDAVRGAFFRLLTTHVMEGFYADPGNGGNLDAVSWQMIGFEVTA